MTRWRLAEKRLRASLARVEELGLNRLYADYGAPEHPDTRGHAERARDLGYYVARIVIRRCKALAAIVKLEEDELRPGDCWETRRWFAGHLLKALICVLCLPERATSGHGWITVGAFNSKTLYAGWSADFVRMDEGWRSWRWQIENDGDWSL